MPDNPLTPVLVSSLGVVAKSIHKIEIDRNKLSFSIFLLSDYLRPIYFTKRLSTNMNSFVTTTSDIIGECLTKERAQMFDDYVDKMNLRKVMPINRIPKTDIRYTMLQTVPEKEYDESDNTVYVYLWINDNKDYFMVYKNYSFQLQTLLYIGKTRVHLLAAKIYYIPDDTRQPDSDDLSDYEGDNPSDLYDDTDDDASSYDSAYDDYYGYKL